MDKGHGWPRLHVIDPQVGSASQVDAAAVRLVHTCQQFDERRLAGPVGAQQSVHFARPDVKVDPVDSQSPAEALGYTSE